MANAGQMCGLPVCYQWAGIASPQVAEAGTLAGNIGRIAEKWTLYLSQNHRWDWRR